MTDAQQREAARQFYYKWNGKGKEDEDARSYWIDILQDILDVDHVTNHVDFEKKVIGGGHLYFEDSTHPDLKSKEMSVHPTGQLPQSDSSFSVGNGESVEYSSCACLRKK